VGELDGLFDPRSIALVGASSDPHGISGRPLRLLIEHGYPGALYPVNPRHRELMGREVFPRIADVLGARVDPDFGPVVLCGLGGLYVEQLGDVALRLVPVSADEARAMVGELRGARLFEGARGRPPATSTRSSGRSRASRRSRRRCRARLRRSRSTRWPCGREGLVWSCWTRRWRCAMSPDRCGVARSSCAAGGRR
jgi:hypothetical protein